MLDVVRKRCSHGGCAKTPSFGVDGSKRADFCSQHAKEGVVNVVSKMCSHTVVSNDQPSAWMAA